MATTQEAPPGRPTLPDLMRQRAKVLHAQRNVRQQTREFAEMLSRLDGTDGVTVASASRAMGFTKGYGTGLVKKLERGDLDVAPDWDAEAEALRREARRLDRATN